MRFYALFSGGKRLFYTLEIFSFFVLRCFSYFFKNFILLLPENSGVKNINFTTPKKNIVHTSGIKRFSSPNVRTIIVRALNAALRRTTISWEVNNRLLCPRGIIYYSFPTIEISIFFEIRCGCKAVGNVTCHTAILCVY